VPAQELREPAHTRVAVAGGELNVTLWGSIRDGVPVFAIHGLTGSSRTWLEVATALPRPVIAPDLRGRGDSGALPGPYGMAAHAADCAAVLDALGVDQADVVGHSMGGFVASVLAHRYPARVARLVLVDGGAPLPAPRGGPESMLGPAARRLEMRFDSPAAYRDHWRAHPSFAEWTPAVQAYVEYDLTGPEGAMRSKVSAAAMRADFTDLHTGADGLDAFAALPAGVPFVRAERGMLNEATPLYADLDVLSRLKVTTVPGANHYSILFGDAGVSAVVAELT
jgi:pimeloyl-ACP methyl ester carboxylesterase